MFSCFNRFQVRYGQHWAPAHPSKTIQGNLTEILLAPGEIFTHLNAASGGVIDAMEFKSNLHTFPRAGNETRLLGISMPLNGLLYFSGALANYHDRHRVSGLVVHQETCETP